MDLPLTVFAGAQVRADDLRFLAGCLGQGQCCSVVGPSNTGKSLLLRSLPKDVFRQLCARPDGHTPVVVFVDCLEAGDSEQALYELLLRRIVDELTDAGMDSSTIESLRALHRDLLGSATDVAIRSIFATSIRELGRVSELGLALILDEMDDAFRTLPPWPFRQLRALRDALGTRLCYVTGTSRRLERLRSDAETYEFRELFHLHTRILRPLDKEDSRRFVAYQMQEHGGALGDERINLLVQLSGGHPGILERIYRILETVEVDPTGSLEDAALRFGEKRPIRQECRRLWDELEEEEQEGLLALTGAGEPALGSVQRRALEAKGLVSLQEAGALSIFSPIFGTFVGRELIRRRGAVAQGIHCDLGTGQVWVDGREVTLELSDLQRNLLRFLFQRAGAVCTYDEIVYEIWGVGRGVTPGAIYELVKRVRQKVEPDWRNPRYLVTVPREGYRLQAPEPQA
jgi:DNA-binding winged helix-turn-helix (wHTH) protein